MGLFGWLKGTFQRRSLEDVEAEIAEIEAEILRLELREAYAARDALLEESERVKESLRPKAD